MKKKIISAFLLSSVLLSACASKDTEKPTNDEQETTTTEETEATEETTEATTEETTEATTEETEPTETEPEKESHVARWIDANLNFGHDSGDGYLVNGKSVPMADYYAALENDESMKCVSIFLDFYRSPLGYADTYSYNLKKSDDITTTQIEFESPGITEGEQESDTVRIDEENCVTYYTIDVPQLTLGTSDSDKANKEIIEFAQAADPWFGAPNVQYQYLEHEDGSKTFVFFYGDGYDDSCFKTFTFDKDNKLMSTDAIVKSAGMDPATFKDDVKKSATEALAYANEFAIYYQGFGITPSYIYEAIENDPDVFVNQNGNLVVFVYSTIPGINGGFWIPFIMDKDLELSTEILEEEFDDEDFEWITEATCDFEIGFGDATENDKTIADVDTADANNYGVANFDLRNLIGSGTWYEEGAKKDPWNFMAILNQIVKEDTTYKFEVYFDGNLIDTDSVTVTANPFFREVNFTYEFDIKPGTYCVVLYDGADSDKVLGAYWNTYRE